MLGREAARLRGVDIDVDVDAIGSGLFFFSVKRLFLLLLAVVTATRLVGLPLLRTFLSVSNLWLQRSVILSPPLLFRLTSLSLAPELQLWVLLRQPVVNLRPELTVLAKRLHLGPKLLQELGQVWLDGNLKSLLYNIVAILVRQVLNEVISLHDFANHQLLNVVTRLL